MIINLSTININNTSEVRHRINKPRTFLHEFFGFLLVLVSMPMSMFMPVLMVMIMVVVMVVVFMRRAQGFFV